MAFSGNVVAITSGSINGTTIGATTPSTVTATTLVVNDNTTLGSSNTDTINFVGRVNSDFEPATDNTYDLGRVGHEWRNLYIDGTANIDNLVADTAAITGGTIDNTTIGSTTPVAGTFTTLSSPSLTAFGVAADVNLSLYSKGTGALSVNTGGGEQFRVTDTASANIYWAATGGVGGSGRATLTTAGNTTATSMQIVNHTAAPVILLTGNTEQLRVSHTASAVNYVQVTGHVTGASASALGGVLFTGSDTNVNGAITTKGVGYIAFAGGGSTSTQAFRVVTTNAASTGNLIAVQGAAAGSSPSIQAISGAGGSDANIDLTLTPKGTGNVRFGTFTADMTLVVQGYIEVKDSGGTIRKLAVIA
jgi:hypothetical protein